MNWPHKPMENFYPDPAESDWGVNPDPDSVEPSRFRRILWIIVTLLIILSLVLPWIVPYLVPRRIPGDSEILAYLSLVLNF